MGFNFLNIFKDTSNKIVSVEEDSEVDYLDKISNDVFGAPSGDSVLNNSDKVQLADNPIEEKIKSIKINSGLNDEKINEFYLKMKSSPDSAFKMAESVLEMLSANEKSGKDAEGVIELLSKKISSESLAKVTAAFMVVLENGKMDEILSKK